MGRRYATKLAATDNADHTITLSHPRPDRSRRVAVKVPSWALAVEREGARGRLQVTKAACACVICRGQKRVLLLRATAEAKRALVSAVEDGRPDPGTLVVDDLRCKVGGTLDPCGDVEAKSTLGLGRLAAHSQRDERAFHANHGREAVVSAAYERPSLTMGLEARVGFIYLGTAALAQLSRFASSSSSKSSTASDPSQAPACRPDPEPAAAEEGEGGGSLRVDAEGVEITLGRTGSSRELCFRLRGGCHLQSSSSDGGYLGVEDTHLSLCSAVGDDEAAVVTRSEVFCQKKAGAGGSREGGLEVSPFSVLLSVGELREIIAMGGEDWGGGGGGGAGASAVSERDSRLEALEGRAASEGPPIGKLVCVRSPLEAGVAACYFQWDLRPRDLEVAGRRESQISYLPPSLSRPRTACGLFRVVAVRGQSKCFRLQLTAPGWEGYHLGVGTGNEVTITRVASRASVLSLDRRGRLQSKDGAPLCLSRLGYWFFQPGSVGQAELVVAAEESVSAACSVFEVSLPEIRFHLLAKKPRAAGFSPRDLASGGMPRGPVDDVSEEELCRASLSMEAEQWGGELGTSSVYHFGASVMLRESNDPEMTETFRADRITMASFAAPKSTESVFGVFAFAPVDLRVHELGVECACIVLQGLREDTGKFRVRHLADLQSRLCGGRAKADRGEGEAAAPKRRKAKSKAAKKTSGWRVSVYHAARISIKVHSCAVEEFLVGEVQELSLRSAASSQLEDVRAVVGKLQVDTYHPDAESRVCLRRRAPHKTLGMPSSSVEPSISARYRSEAPEGRPTETEISAFLALSPASIVLHEPVVQECLSLFPGYGKAEVEAAQKIQRFWKRRKGPKDNTLGGMDEARPRRGWFGRARGRGRGRGRTPGEENTAATKIQRWWKKKKKKEKGRQVRRGKASTKWMDGTRKIKVLDILLPDLEATFKFDWSSGDVDRRNLASSLDRGTVLDDFQAILSVLGAPEVGTIHVAQKRILLSDLEMSPKEIAKTASQQLTQGVLLAIAREHVDSLGIPWMDGVVGEYLEAVGKGRGAAEVSGDGGEARGQERGGSWVTRPWRILLDPVVFLSRAAAASVKHAGWTLLVSAALDMTDRAVKSAETDGLRGVYSAVTATGINMLTTPPKQAVFRIWASRNALTSDLRVTFRLSGQHASTNAPYLEAYVQGIVDHVFQLKNTMVSVDDDVLTMQNLPVLEREREELIDYVEFILDSEGLLLVEGEGASGTKKGRHVAGLDSTSFSAKLRHLPHKRKDPRKQLLYIGYLFVQNVAVVMSSGFFVRSLPFHRAMGRLENRWVRRGLGTAIVFGYRRLQWLVPGTFAKKVCHSYLLNLAFGPKEEENEEEGAEGGKN